MVDGTKLRDILCLTEQRVFVQNLENERTRDVPVGMVQVGKKWNFEGVVSVKGVAWSGQCSKLREVQRVCEGGDEAVPGMTVEVI